MFVACIFNALKTFCSFLRIEKKSIKVIDPNDGLVEISKS